MASEHRPAKRDERPPGSGWELGAAGLGKAGWITLTALLAILGIVLLAGGYVGYGIMILVLAVAAAVNLF